MSIIVQVILAGLVIGGVYCLIGYGFVLCWRVANVINLAQASSGVFGAFVCLHLTWAGTPVHIASMCGIAVAGILGLITERLIITPLRRSRIIGWLIGGLGVEILLRRCMSYIWGSDWLKFPSLLGGEKTITIFGAATSNDRLLLIIAAFLIVSILERI